MSGHNRKTARNAHLMSDLDRGVSYEDLMAKYHMTRKALHQFVYVYRKSRPEPSDDQAEPKTCLHCGAKTPCAPY